MMENIQLDKIKIDIMKDLNIKFQAFRPSLNDYWSIQTNEVVCYINPKFI